MANVRQELSRFLLYGKASKSVLYCFIKLAEVLVYDEAYYHKTR